MVKIVTGFGRSGLHDWVIQRASALVIALYLAYWSFIGACYGLPTEYFAWRGLFQPMWMQVFSLLFLISLVLHAWIGMWTVLTDYVKPTLLRLFLQLLFIFVLLASLLWGALVLWGTQ